MKRLILLAITALAVGITFAAPPPPRHGPRPAPRPYVTHVHHHPYHYHHHDHYHHHGAHPGAFWGGFAGALVGTAIYEASKPVIVAAPAPQPTVIIQNPAISRQVWVEGHYENQVLANGTIVKIWVPGRWVEVR